MISGIMYARMEKWSEEGKGEETEMDGFKEETGTGDGYGFWGAF